MRARNSPNVTGLRHRRRRRLRPSLVHTAASYAVIALAMSPGLYGLVHGGFAAAPETVVGAQPPAETGGQPPLPAPPQQPEAAVAADPGPPAAPQGAAPQEAPGAEAVSPSPVQQLADAAPSSGVVAEAKPADPVIDEPPPAAAVPDSPAAVVERVQPPNYPNGSWRRGVQGTALVTALVGVDGRLASPPMIARSAGAADLDEAALAAFRQWRFAPAVRDGQPAEGPVQGEFVFRLR